MTLWFYTANYPTTRWAATLHRELSALADKAAGWPAPPEKEDDNTDDDDAEDEETAAGEAGKKGAAAGKGGGGRGPPATAASTAAALRGVSDCWGVLSRRVEVLARDRERMEAR